MSLKKIIRRIWKRNMKLINTAPDPSKHPYFYISLDYKGSILNVRNLGLTKFTIPKKVERVHCGFNELTELTVPKGVKEVWCQHNQLTEINLPSSVKMFNGKGNPWDSNFIKWHNLKYSGDWRMMIDPEDVNEPREEAWIYS